MKQLFIDFKQFDNLQCDLKGFSIVKESNNTYVQHKFYLINDKHNTKEEIFNIDFHSLYNLGYNNLYEILNKKINIENTDIKRKIKI